TGLRPGEKLYEELLTAAEGATVTRHEKIFVAAPPPTDAAALDTAIDALAARAAAGDVDGIRALLHQIVPTYHDPAPAPLPEPPAAPLPLPETDGALTSFEPRARTVPGGRTAPAPP